MAISDDWCAHRFDHLSPELALDLHETLARMREDHPVTWSEEHGGFWVVTRYEDVLRVAQDWQAFSSAQGVSVPETGKMVVPAIPEHLDPPLHRTYKRLINAHFTPAVVATYEAPDPRPRHPADRRVRRGRQLRLHGRLRPALPRPGLLRPRARRPARRGGRDQPAGHHRLGVDQPRRPRRVAIDVPVDHRLRGRPPAPARPGRRRRRRAGRRDRGPAHHRRRDHRRRPAAHPGRARHDGRGARARS